MRRFLSVYRWELTLVVGISIVADIVSSTAYVGIGSVVGEYEALTAIQVASNLLGVITTCVVLFLLYDRVRRQGRDLLVLLWGYSLWTALIWMLSLGVALLVYTLVYTLSPTTEEGYLALRLTLIMNVIGVVALLPQLGVLLWFARRASRHSLMHMCFVVVWGAAALGLGASSPAHSGFPQVYASYLVTGAVGLAVMVLEVWLLGNFDSRGFRFRRNAVLALVAAAFMSGYAGMLLAGLDGYWGGLYVWVLFVLAWSGIGELRYASLDALDDLAGVVALVTYTAFELMVLAALFGLAYVMRARSPSAPADDNMNISTA